MNDDNDLRALREFRVELDEPRDGGLARGRYRLAREDARPPVRRRQWLLASAGAAAAVAAVVAAAATLNKPAPAGEGGPESVAAPPSVAASPTKGLPQVPAGAKVSTEPGGTHQKAVAALTRLAGAANDQGIIAVGPGQALFIKSYTLSTGAGAYSHEMWVDPEHAVALQIRRMDGGVVSIDDVSPQAERDRDAAEPGSLVHPTKQYLAGLPTDPAALLASWRAEEGAEDTDRKVGKDLTELLFMADPSLTAQQRALIFKAYALLPGVKATTVHIDATAYDLVCQVSGANADCVLLDGTGHFAGRATPGADLAVRNENLTLTAYGVQPAPPATAASRQPVETKTAKK